MTLMERSWQIPPEQIECGPRIDGNTPGAFGEVYRGTYMGRPVAIKKLQKLFVDGEDMETIYRERFIEFEREMSYLKTIRHGNIVYFYGAGYELSLESKRSVPFLVTEFMGAGLIHGSWCC